MKQRYVFRDDYISSSELSKRIGFPISRRFITEELGVKPDFNTQNGSYFAPATVASILRKLIMHLAEHVEEIELLK